MTLRMIRSIDRDATRSGEVLRLTSEFKIKIGPGV